MLFADDVPSGPTQDDGDSDPLLGALRRATLTNDAVATVRGVEHPVVGPATVAVRLVHVVFSFHHALDLHLGHSAMLALRGTQRYPHRRQVACWIRIVGLSLDSGMGIVYHMGVASQEPGRGGVGEGSDPPARHQYPCPAGAPPTEGAFFRECDGFPKDASPDFVAGVAWAAAHARRTEWIALAQHLEAVVSG